MKKKFDVAVFIGRFQPLTIAHEHVMREALKQAERLIVLIGSAGSARTIRNPFTWQERADIIYRTLEDVPDTVDGLNRVTCIGIRDYPYNDPKWIAQVEHLVNSNLAIDEKKIAIIGHDKDSTTEYLKWFPRWKSIEIPNFESISATDARETFLRTGQHHHNTLTVASQHFLQDFLKKHPAYDYLRAEMNEADNYKRPYENLPFPPTFTTVDSVVLQSANVLLIERKDFPGKGLLALPGGFLDPSERIVDAYIRELKEETRLKVPAPVLKGSTINRRVYDYPNRSSRGRVITHAFLINLAPAETFPEVRAASDAKKAFWKPLSELKEWEMFDDHYHIIQDMVSSINTY